MIKFFNSKMDVFFFLLIVFMSFAFILGAIKPSILGLNSRKSVVFFTILPSIFFFLLWGYYGIEQEKKALKNPQEAENLNFKNTQLTETPELLRGLSNLKTLDLSKNKITMLDSSIILSLKNLEELNISDNPISEFPIWLSKLEKLEKVSIENTFIEYLPHNSAEKFSIFYKKSSIRKSIEKK